MSSPTVGFNSLVDIATSMAIQSLDKPSRHDISKGHPLTEASFEDEFEFGASHSPRKEWVRRISDWQVESPEIATPVEDCTSLRDLEISTLFLQHPFAAMALWNVMETFYALDRLVCCTSDETLSRIIEWESMPLFVYMEAPEVEERWRSSLQLLKAQIKDYNSIMPPSPLLPVKREERRGSSKYLLGSGIKTDVVFRRIDGIFTGIAKLEEVQGDLERSFKMNLEDFHMVDCMMKAIDKAANVRFSMIDTYLRMDDDTAYVSSDIAGNFARGDYFTATKSPNAKAVWTPKPLTRKNSMKDNCQF